MPNPANLTAEEITDLVRELVNSRPGLNRLVTNVAYDKSETSSGLVVIRVTVDPDALGTGANLSTSPPNLDGTKTKLSLDDGVSKSSGAGHASQSGMPGPVSVA